MKNKDRQSSLDKKKWQESIINKKDMSGKMNYCKGCRWQEKDTCAIPHETRAFIYACAKNYNRLTNTRRKDNV